MSAFICQCKEGTYHVNPEYGIVEVLDMDNNPVQTGNAGRLVCTGFLNFAMPLIRYDMGDTVVLSDRKCDCGRRFPVVESILGRTDDLIITPSGKTIGRLDPVFKGLSHIRETQIVQEAYDKITVNLVKDDGFSNDTAEALKRELTRRIGDDVEVSINIVGHIPRTKAGKFRSVISHIAK
jgi:phenylacetate-CoA ligase